MVRTARWFVVSVVSLAVIGLAGVSSACDSAKKAEAKTASVEGKAGCASKATAVNADAKVGCASKASAEFAGAGCSSKKASKMANAHDCGACDLMAELKANQGKVKVSTVSSENGVTLVFAAVTQDDVPVAKEVASHAYSLMNAPAKCAYTRAQMAEKSCDGCKSGFAAFADAKVTFEENESGAEAIVETKDEKKVEELQTFIASLYVADEKGE